MIVYRIIKFISNLGKAQNGGKIFHDSTLFSGIVSFSLNVLKSNQKFTGQSILLWRKEGSMIKYFVQHLSWSFFVAAGSWISLTKIAMFCGLVLKHLQKVLQIRNLSIKLSLELFYLMLQLSHICKGYKSVELCNFNLTGS